MVVGRIREIDDAIIKEVIVFVTKASKSKLILSMPTVKKQIPRIYAVSLIRRKAIMCEKKVRSYEKGVNHNVTNEV